MMRATIMAHTKSRSRHGLEPMSWISSSCSKALQTACTGPCVRERMVSKAWLISTYDLPCREPLINSRVGLGRWTDWRVFFSALCHFCHDRNGAGVWSDGFFRFECF